jgi:carbonic anhydrase
MAPATDDLLARNAAFVATHTPEQLAGPPRLQLAVVTCMDARIDVAGALGVRPGEAHVIRNAGGLVTDDVLRSLVLSQRLLGTVEVMVIQHTGCGVHGLEDAELARQLTEETGAPPPFAFGGFTDLEASVRSSLDRIRSCPWLPATGAVRGFVYEIDTARVREVGWRPAPS